MLLVLTTTKLLDISRNHIVISHVHKQRDMCTVQNKRRTICLRLIQTHYYSNNITNNLAVTLKTWRDHCRLSAFHTCIYS